MKKNSGSSLRQLFLSCCLLHYLQRTLHSGHQVCGGFPQCQAIVYDTGCCCCCCVASVVSDSVRPHGRQPTRLPRPRDSPGKNTGVGCHFLRQCMKVKSESEVARSCPTLSDPMDCSPPGSSIHGILQARVLEWGAIALSGDTSWVSYNLTQFWQSLPGHSVRSHRLGT